MGKGKTATRPLFADLERQSAEAIEDRQSGGGGPKEAWGGDTVHLVVPLTDGTGRAGYPVIHCRMVEADDHGALALGAMIEKPYPGMLKSRIEKGDNERSGEWWGHLIAVRWIKQTEKGHVVEAVSHGPCGDHGLILDDAPAV